LPKLFGERILNKLPQNFCTNDIPFGLLTFGQLFGIVKTEGLSLCNEIKIQSKYGDERAQSWREMGTFCEGFGITKIEAPSTAPKKAQKKQAKFRPKVPKVPPKQPKPFVKKEQPKTVTKKMKVVKKSKQLVCYKCGKTGHKAFQWKTEQKINELFSGDPDLKQKMLSLLIQEASGSDEDYYAEESDDSEYESSPLQVLNVISSKPQKEFLINLIGKIPNLDAKRDYLEHLKEIILEEDKT